MNDTPPRFDLDSPCHAYRTLIGDLVGDELDLALATRIERHAAQCAACRRTLASARALRRTLLRVGRGERARAALRDRVITIRRTLRGPDRS